MIRAMQGRHILLWLAATLLITAVLGLLGITALMSSETGSRRLLEKIAAYSGIGIGQISGRLATGMKLEELHYRNSTTDVRIGELSFNWDPWALLYGTGKFRSVRIDGLSISYTANPGKSASRNKKALPDFSLPLRVVLDAADLHALRVDYGERRLGLEHVHIEAALGSRLTLEHLSMQTAAYQVTASGAINGGFPYTGELALQWRYHHASGSEFTGMADIRGDINRFELEHQLTSPAHLKTTGHIVSGIVDNGQPHAELHNRWDGQRLPLLPLLVNTSGELQVSGWLNDYRLHGRGGFEYASLSPFGFLLDTGGDRNGLHNANLKLDALKGKISATGSMQWMPALSWRADIAADGIDLDSIHPHLPTGLRLELQTEGARVAGRWQGRLDHIRGAGTVRAHALSLQGELEFDGLALGSRSLQLSVAENSLMLSGKIGRQFDLQWKLNAPRLSALWPGLEGLLNAGGNITGSRNSPRLKAVITGEKLAYADYRISRLDAGLQTENARRHVLTVTAKQVMAHGRTASLFALQASGNAAAHVIEGRVQDDYLKATAVLGGDYRNSRWQGQIRKADWQPGNLPAWSLQQPVSMAIDTGSVHIEPACWSATSARICGHFARRNNGDIRGEAGLHAVPAGLLDSWLNPRVTLNGLMDGSLNVSGRGSDLTGSLELRAPSGAASVRRDGRPADSYRWENAFLKAGLQNKRLTATAGLTFPEYGDTQSALSVDLRNSMLKGSIAARFDNLAPLQSLVPDLNDLKGYLESGITVAGTIDRPQLSGSLLLSDASARIPRFGIQIRNMGLRARSDQNMNVIFQGAAESGEGRLQLDGKLVYGKTPSLEAAVDGKDFEILHLPHIHARISPSLDIEAGPRRVHVRGTVNIPSAQMNIRAPPESIVAVSDDVIIINAAPDNQQNDAYEFTSYVRLILGEDVQFQGFGFNVGLDGQLILNKTPDRPVATTGALTVKQGQYKAFGQQLEIERGRLLFQGPYDNPGLDILAARSIPDTTVKLEVGGTLESPRSRVYSDPPLPDSEAMAILLTGKPLQSASKSDANAVVNAIAGLGLRKGKFITDDIARTFKLDEFNIKSEPGSDVTTSSLFIGKQISPRLFIRYIVGLFDQTSRIGLSYQLSRQLKLEAESGWNQSMDLIYEIER